MKIDTITHPLNSLDLTFSNFFLFRNLQTHFNGKSFANTDDVINEVRSYFDSKNADFFKTYKVVYHWQQCFIKH